MSSRRQFFLPLVAALALAGCRSTTRLAWAAEMRGISSFEPEDGLSGQMLKNSSALAHYFNGLLAEGQGELELAKHHYTLGRAFDPTAAPISLRLGVVQMRLNDTAAAIESFEMASRRRPTDSRIRFLLGVLYASQERFEESATQYSEILNTEPGNLGALSHLADLYVIQEKLQEALSVYERLLKERPDSPVAHFNVGVFYAKAGQLSEALRHLKKTVEIDPAHLEAHLVLAVVLELTGDLKSAKEQLLAALPLDPSNTQLIHGLAEVSYRLHEPEEAAKWLTTYLSYKPRDPAGILELCSLWIEQGNWRQAATLMQAAVNQQGAGETPLELWLALGMSYEAGGADSEAEAVFGQAKDKDPTDVRPLLHLGGLFMKRSRFQEAEKVYEEAFRINPDDPEVLNSLGFFYAEEGAHLEEAVTLLQRAISQDPTNGAFLDSLGWVYFKMNHLEEALGLLKEAARRMPDAEIFYHLGEVYLSLGDPHAARAVWNKGLELSPKGSLFIQKIESRVKGLNNRKD